MDSQERAVGCEIPASAPSNVSAKRDVLRTRHDEPTVRGPFIHLDLQVGKQLGHILDLVNDSALRALHKKSAGITADTCPHVEGLEIDVRLLWERPCARKRRIV